MIPGYGSKFSWIALPDGAEETDSGLLITAGTAKTESKLELTNEAHTTDVVYRLVNESGIPMAGEKVKIFTSDPTENPGASPVKEVAVSIDGTVRFPGMRRRATYYVQHPGGEIMTIEAPTDDAEKPRVILPDGTAEPLTEDYKAEGVTPPNQQWEITVRKVISGGTNPLAGATIGLYADEACQALIKTDVSGPDGIVTFSGLIKGQDYWVKETAAPSNYELNASAYAVSEADPDATVENTPKKAPPVSPGGPVDPGEPDNPGNPGNPGEPSNHDEPGDPESPDSGGISTNNPNIPQTGDYRGLLIVVTLLSGILLASMTVYQL